MKVKLLELIFFFRFNKNWVVENINYLIENRLIDFKK